MFEAENIRDWRGLDVVDYDGRKIGTLESIYFDTLTDRPAFATVTTGLPTRRRLVFVPVDKATVAPAHLKVTYDKSLVKDAPGIDPDGELAAEDEGAVFAHYHLPYEPGSRGERRLGRR
ncbi:PRC-barrel domain-containing protein [Streptomyces sp. BBFR51]|uniref:PRC-barrel domain-containing protein n=1 Tax=Streptomyces sp. BBFR51 TaxID=3372856 RepID=UPI0037DCF6BD